MGKLSRTKGHNWERTVANRLSAALGIECKRVLTEVRDGLVGDIDTGSAPLSVQCKCGKAPSPWKALREAQEAADGTGRFAVAILRRNAASSHEQPEDVALMPLSDFEEILSQLKASGAW